MDKKENTQGFSLEDILREFSDNPDELPALESTGSITEAVATLMAETEAAEAALAQAEAEAAEEARRAAEAEEAARIAAEQAAAQPEEPAVEAVPDEEPSAEAEAPAEEPKAEEPEAPMPRPVVIRPRTRLQLLKKQIVAGPEKRFYELTEIGLGRVQLAAFACFLLVLLCAGATAMFAMDMVPGNRMRLMLFSQVLTLLVSALLGCYVLMDGIADLLKLRFSLNSMLFITFLACCADAVFCLQEVRVPCCAAFALEMTMALWNRRLRRMTELGQMDTLRRAVRLDCIVKVPDYYEGRPGIVRGEGQIADFMDNYTVPSGPERTQNIFAFIALIVCCGIAGFTAVRHSISLGVQIFAISLLAAMPATFFIAVSRPGAILEKRLHSVGTVICGWQGVKGLTGSAVFPLRDQDLFPMGSTKFNGVKFYGDRNPDETMAYAAALMTAENTGLAHIFAQQLKNRDGAVYEVENFIDYPNGGIGGEVRGEPVLMGSLNFLQNMGVEIPEGTMVNQAVYCAIDGQLSAVFAIAYAKMKSAASGLVTLCGYRKITPVLVCGDIMIDESFLRSKFGINTRRFAFPDRQLRRQMRAVQPDEETIALALTIQDSLSSSAYAVTGARVLRTACRLGLIVHIAAGIVGMLIMAALAILGSADLLTPFNVLMYQVVWTVPGLLLSAWTTSV